MGHIISTRNNLQDWWEGWSLEVGQGLGKDVLLGIPPRRSHPWICGGAILRRGGAEVRHPSCNIQRCKSVTQFHGLLMLGTLIFKRRWGICIVYFNFPVLWLKSNLRSQSVSIKLICFSSNRLPRCNMNYSTAICLGSPQRFKETCGAITHLDKTNYNFFFNKV